MYTHKVHKRVAKLHKDTIERGFLKELGLPFLTLLYWAIDSSKNSVLIVHEFEDEVAGFVSATLSIKGLIKRMIARPIALSLALLPSILIPKRVISIFELLFYNKKSAKMKLLPAAELLSLAVNPAFQGKGVSDELYLKLINHFKENNVSSFSFTVGNTLNYAHSFYLRMGAVPVGKIEVHAGVESTVYVQSF